MSVMEIVNQVRTLPQAEQLEVFKEMQQLEQEQKIMVQFSDVLHQPIQKEYVEIPEDQADYVLLLLEKEGITLP